MPKKVNYDLELPKPNEIIPAKLKNPRSILYYAEPKLGKTSLLTTLPNSILLDIEDGSDAADTGAKINVVQKAAEWGFLEELPKELAVLKALNIIGGKIIEQNNPYDYVIADTLTELAECCLEEGTRMLKASVIGKNFVGESCLELPKGGGYYWWRKAYGIYFNGLMSLPRKCFIGVAHIKDAMLTNKEGKEVMSSDLSLTGQLKQITCAKIDAIGYLYRKTVGAEEGKPLDEIWVSFRSSGINTGNRFRRLTYKDFFLSKIVNSEDEKIVGHWDEIFIPE